MGLTMATIAEALKLFYLDGMRYQLNEQASVFLTQLERDSEAVMGKEIVMPLSYGVTGGIGNRADDGLLPTPNPRKFKQAKWETKNIFARIRLTDKTIEASRGNRGAFIQALEHELSKAEIDAKKDLSRQVMGDGTGLLAKVTAITSSGNDRTVTVDNVKFFAEGMLIDVYTGTTKDTAGAEVKSVDKATSKILFTSATAPEADDLIYVAGNRDLEITGVEAVFDTDSTLYGVERATNKWFNPTKVTVNGEISEVIIQEGIDEAEDEAGTIINFLLCSKGVRRAYQNLLTAQKQLVNTLDLKGGWKAMSYNGIPLVADRYVKAGTLYGMDTRDWKMYEMADWDWLDKDGGIIARVPNYPTWEATLRKYGDIGCQRPKGQVEYTGITEH